MLHFNDEPDELLGWTLGSWLAFLTRGIKQPIFQSLECFVESRQGRWSENNCGPSDMVRPEEKRPESQQETTDHRKIGCAFPGAIDDKKLLFHKQPLLLLLCSVDLFGGGMIKLYLVQHGEAVAVPQRKSWLFPSYRRIRYQTV